MSHLDPAIAHLLRRAGFGLNAADSDSWNRLGLAGAVAQLVDYESVPDDVDDSIGVPGYFGTTSRGPFEPDYRISDARQRWLFRLVHTQRPLQEKMALFWHNHFATGFGKIAGQIGPGAASRALGAKPDPNFSNLRGQLEVFRDLALGSFEQLLRTVSQDPAMVAWLDGDTNTKEKPQENYSRELMELFTIGVDTFTESDVHEGARVFTGWNLRGLGFDRDDPSQQHVAFFYNQGQHDVEPKTFSFPIYPTGAGPFRDARRCSACRMVTISSVPWSDTPQPVRDWRESSMRSSSTSSIPPMRRSFNSCRRRTTRRILTCGRS